MGGSGAARAERRGEGGDGASDGRQTTALRGNVVVTSSGLVVADIGDEDRVTE